MGIYEVCMWNIKTGKTKERAYKEFPNRDKAEIWCVEKSGDIAFPKYVFFTSGLVDPATPLKSFTWEKK